MKINSILIDLLSAIVIGAVTSYWISGNISFFIGIVTFFSLELLRLRFWVEKIYEQYSYISSFFEAFQVNDRFTELILIYGFRKFGKAFKSSVFVEREDVWEFWRDCISRVQNKWRVITYARIGKFCPRFEIVS